jgi:hypothetical protein
MSTLVTQLHYKHECALRHDLVVDFGGIKPPIVVLCGSTRFVDEFNQQRKTLTEQGWIVLSIEVVTTQARDADPQHCNPTLKAALDELHLRKIDLADEVLVLDVGGYIGESTAREIRYAQQVGKPVRYLSERAA